MAAEHDDFVLFSVDVSQAFAKGMTFKELSAPTTGLELREVQFDIPHNDLEILRQILAFKGYDPLQECLNMIKPVYGLKDAPRAWRKKLHQVLIAWMSCRQLDAEPELHCVHGKERGPVPKFALIRPVASTEYKRKNPIERAKEHSDDIAEQGT